MQLLLPLPDINHLTSVKFVAPGTPVEKELATIWAKLLELDQVGIQHNFLELGGHSLLATQAVSRLKQAFTIDIPLRSFLKPHSGRTRPKNRDHSLGKRE